MDASKYKKMYFPVPLDRRTWPGNEITKAPIWCSVDLRDGNQALETPLSPEEKLMFFNMLTEIGVKEIEVAFPAASDSDYTFVRTLIEQKLIPDDTKISVLAQMRPHILEKTFEAIDGAKNVIVHLYNSTSELQRRLVFGLSKEEIKEIATKGAEQALALSKKHTGKVWFEYSPESFMGTEAEYSAEICNAVLDVLKPAEVGKVIINLPETLEMATPNVYADHIEYMCNHLKYRENVLVSLHTHNDRGCAVAATEMGLLAGADRVEGTLFGNGERTGNADLMVIAMNMYMQGIDPGLNFSSMESLADMYETITHMDIHPRHPYAGELVFTAFSGSHQDAIKKCMDYSASHPQNKWENPYITINPADIGRHFDPIRINSQSGKSGIAFVMQRKFGVFLPKSVSQELSFILTDVSDREHKELTPQLIYDTFIDEFVDIVKPVRLIDYDVLSKKGQTEIVVTMDCEGEDKKYIGTGNGPLDAMADVIRTGMGLNIEISGYHEHALQHGSSSEALAYVGIKDMENRTTWGAGSDTNISTASIKALISAANRYILKFEKKD
ncbi:MAG: 2-isopropylmalate synthase [Clostridia bacterium]|nr:2-isopropylmalate synthase [Clostridia bacterium]